MDNGQWTMDEGLGWLSSRRDQQARPQICVLVHPAKQQSLEKFSWLFVWFVVKKWICGRSVYAKYSVVKMFLVVICNAPACQAVKEEA
jgi:hypothetical protein